jgi:hypothetical protein
MQLGTGPLRFSFVVACAAAFVWSSGGELPNLVASHFGASGVADGLMPHGVYVSFMLGFVVGLPAALVFLT